MDVLVVESPAKAKTIGKYLGPGYTVLASYGHVRDLPPKDGSVRPDEDFAMDWEVDPQSQKRLDAIAKAITKGGKLYLATDPDREGEAISWHVRDVLKRKKALEGVDVKRVTFNAITKQSVLDAVAHPRELDQDLIDAYMARRALDYLVGFTLSPVLWRKLPGSRSAGRVQSVALRLICEREAEIEVFKTREYWTVDALFGTAKKQTLKARLTHLDGRKLDKFDLDTQERAEQAKREIERRAFSVASIDRRQVRRNPPPPFITSTLQQEASRKLGVGAATAMRIAQRLYEGVDIGGETVGLITYMRTDGVQLAPEAIGQTRRLIETKYGQSYVPEKPRVYTSKAKNAQEAHEAIRPTDLFRTPQDVAAYLDKDQLGLYELIWKRTVASQMESAVLDQVTVDIASADKTVQLRATGSVVKFNGFLTLYDEGKDENGTDADEEGNAILPDVTQDEGARAPRRHPRAAFHRAAAALFRGQPGQEARGAGHRPPLDLRQHHRSAAAPELREDRPQALHSGRPRPHRHGLPADLFPALRRIQLHRPSRGRAGRDLRRQDRLAPGAARVLEGLLRRGRRDQGPARQRGAGQARRGARARTSSRPTTTAARARATARPAPTAGSA